jgi:acetylornithine/succinyldiaminopimelate/putrescine aminotransferase
VAEGYKHGLILVNAGPNVLRFVPPLVITEDEIKQVVSKIAMLLKQV